MTEAGYVWEVCGALDSEEKPNDDVGFSRDGPETLVVLLHGLRGSSDDWDPCVTELRRSTRRRSLTMTRPASPFADICHAGEVVLTSDRTQALDARRKQLGS